MKTLSVIQIGDIHFPEARNKTIADLKDDAVSEGFSDRLAPKKLPRVFREVARIRDEFLPCGILICGDLTTKGDVQQYDDCIQYLTRCLSLGDSRVTNPDHWHVVPGNHDVDRMSLAPGTHPFPGLFTPLNDLWTANCPTSTLTVDQTRVTQLEHDGCGITLLSLNSCVGCGEWRRLPKRIREQLSEEIESTLSEQAKTEQFCEIAEQLDAPAFDKTHLDDVSTRIQQLGRNSVPIVLTHHNLLPQQMPRMAPYTELSNGGMLRTRLTSLGRPVVYCHGHIHEELIEVVSDPRSSGGFLTSVSAPEAAEGFIRISVDFNRDKEPLGVQIVCYELRNNGDVKDTSPVRIRLLPANAPPPDEIRHVAEVSKSSSEPLTMVRKRFNAEGRFGSPQLKTFRDYLLEAEWHGLVELDDRDADPKYIRVRKVDR